MNDDDVTRLRAKAIKNLAASMGIPPALLAEIPSPDLTLDEQAEEVAEAARKAYDEILAHAHVTFIWPWLRALGIPDAERYHLVHPDGYLLARAQAGETLPLKSSRTLRGWTALPSGPPLHEHPRPEHVAIADTLYQRLAERGIAQRHQAMIVRVSLDGGTSESILISHDHHLGGDLHVLVNLLAWERPEPNAAGQECVLAEEGAWEVMHLRPDRLPNGITGRVVMFHDLEAVARREVLSGLNERSEIETVADRIERVLATIAW